MTPNDSELWFLPLGGTGEIGMNMNLYGHNGQWLMVDCGVMFEKHTDVDGKEIKTDKPHIQMADPQFIVDRREQLVGLVITHAHEDHIGAVPYLWNWLRCPVYTTRFTAEILQRKLRDVGLDKKVPITIVEENSVVEIGVFQLRWIALTHSIPEPYGLHISTAVGHVFHTADWKLDPSPVLGKRYQKENYKKLADIEIDAMICDSTNATVQGWSESEANLYHGLKHYIEQAKGRVIVTCFGSNLARLHTIANIAEETGRHLGLLGRSLVNMMAAAKRTDLWPLVTTHIQSSHLGYLPRHTVLLVVTGSQGEPGAALSRLSMNQFRDLQLEPGDTVIFSSKVIPGNEISINNLIERLKAMGINVITNEDSRLPIHASGHPASEELKAMYEWVKPDCVIPVHGEPHHLKANAKLAKSQGIRRQLVGKNGDLYLISPITGIRRNYTKTSRLGVDKKGNLVKIS